MTAADEYDKKKVVVDKFLERITDELLVHAARQERDPKHWGYVGDLGMIEQRLAEILGSLDGLSDDERTAYRL